MFNNSTKIFGILTKLLESLSEIHTILSEMIRFSLKSEMFKILTEISDISIDIVDILTEISDIRTEIFETLTQMIDIPTESFEILIKMLRFRQK